MDLYDEDTKILIKETFLNNKTRQELVIPAFKIYNKEVGTGTGNEKILSSLYEIRTCPDNVAILKKNSM